MSLIYLLIINKIGFFHLGRFVDLLQIDLIIALLGVIMIFEVKRWHRLKEMDNGK